jgi:hypothetical protein
MSVPIRALLAIAIAFAAAAVMATIPGALVDVLAGMVGLGAVVAFMRMIMAFAAEPSEEGPRPNRPR